jgi:hypothetical protein
MVARSLDPHALVRSGFHNDRRHSQIDDRQMATCDPFHALWVTLISASGQVGS